MSDYLNTIPPSMPEMLPYFKIHIVGWDYVEQLEKILEHLKERTQLEIINKHTRKT